MDTNAWICYLSPIFIFFMLYLGEQKTKKKVRQHIKYKKGSVDNMNEIIEKFMNKGVCVTTIDGKDIGRLVSYNDGWITISDNGNEQCINTEYIVKIEGFKLPEDKKKKKDK